MNSIDKLFCYQNALCYKMLAHKWMYLVLLIYLFKSNHQPVIHVASNE